MSEPSTIGLKVGLEVLTKVAPTGFAWLRSRLFGETLLAIGERRAGKSSFVNYLEHGILLKPGTKTPRTLEVRNTASFDYNLGRDKSLRVSVKRATDTRGHDSIKEQVALIYRRAPSILLIFVDASRDWSSADEDYGLRYLNKLLKAINIKGYNSKRLRNNLKHMAVIINKVDLLDNAVINEKIESVKSVFDKFASPTWSEHSDEVAIHKCISVDVSGAAEGIDEVIKSVMVSTVMFKKIRD